MTDLIDLVMNFQKDLRKHNVEVCILGFNVTGHQHFIDALELQLGRKVHRDRTILFNRTEVLAPEPDVEIDS